MANKGQFQPGQSGNPNGRPPKSRALTDLLEKALSRTVDFEGKRISGKRLVARLVADIVTMGWTEFPDGTKLTISPKDWLEFVKWIYSQIDGPPKHQVELDTTGSLIIEYVNNWRDAEDNTS